MTQEDWEIENQLMFLFDDSPEMWIKDTEIETYLSTEAVEIAEKLVKRNELQKRTSIGYTEYKQS